MELVKMSAKGQLVVPQDIRKKESYKEGDRFMVVQTKQGLMFKKVNIKDIAKRFEEVTKITEEHFRKNNITPEDVEKAIQWVRKQQS